MATGRTEEERSGTKETGWHRGNRRQGRSGRGEKKDGRLSSQKQADGDERNRKEREKAEKKGTQGTGRRQALVEQLWERSEEGRKETNREPSKRIQESRMRNQTEGTEENRKARAELSTGQAAVRRKREELNGRNRG